MKLLTTSRQELRHILRGLIRPQKLQVKGIVGLLARRDHLKLIYHEHGLLCVHNKRLQVASDRDALLLIQAGLSHLLQLLKRLLYEFRYVLNLHQYFRVIGLLNKLNQLHEDSIDQSHLVLVVLKSILQSDEALVLLLVLRIEMLSERSFLLCQASEYIAEAILNVVLLRR